MTEPQPVKTATVRLPKIVLEEKAGVRVARGHLWIFSNEIIDAEPEAEVAREVAVFSGKGDFLGCASYNHQALIRARVYSRRSERLLGDLLRARLEAAISRRRRMLPDREAVRLAFSESDLLPGLVVDQYGPVLVVQFLTRFMDEARDEVVAALQEILQPEAIVDRSDVPARENEGLPAVREILHGQLPDPLLVSINGLKMSVDVLQGQKTGLFLDQVENWRLMEQLAPGREVLDLFSNQGGFALHARRAGASSVKAVDSSGDALSKLLFNAARNDIADIKTKESDAFQYVRSRPGEFDVIVCDPPAFAKSRKQLQAALRGYRELNRHCLKMLRPGGVLLSCSCSAAVTPADFDKMLMIAAQDAGRWVRLLAGGGQPADHAPLASMPETNYLKVRLVEVVE